MAVIGSATLNIVPKVQGGLANAISGEIGKANLSSLGKSAGGSLCHVGAVHGGELTKLGQFYLIVELANGQGGVNENRGLCLLCLG